MLVDPMDEEDTDLDEDKEQKEARQLRNKANLLKWVTEADFANEFDFVQLANHPFELSDNEQTLNIDIPKLVKILKM